MSPIEQPVVFKVGIARTGFRSGENQLAIRRPCKAGRIVPMLAVSGQLNGGNLFSIGYMFDSQRRAIERLVNRDLGQFPAARRQHTWCFLETRNGLSRS